LGQLVFLKDLVIIFATAVIVVALLRRIHIPSIAGFIVAGVLAGPSGLRLVDDIHQVEVLAEVGVVLLLFGIGLELSIDRIRQLWRAVIVGGAVQVGLTILVVVGIATLRDIRFNSAVFLGFVIAISSTAIVLRGLATRGELQAPHGRLALGILLFQDLCVVPMILVIPLLGHAGGGGAAPLRTLLKAILVLGGVLAAARLIVPRLLEVVARTRQRDLFVLAVFLICLGTAWVLSIVGISLALGAFLAGLVVAGSEFRHQAMSDLVPFREVLASIFFVSIGMLLDLGSILLYAGPILGILAAILLGKFAIIFVTAAFMRLPLRVCILTGAALAQVGEFSFVLLRTAGGYELLPEPFAGNLLVAIILSMLITPFALALGPHLASGADRMGWLTRLLQVRTPEDVQRDMDLRDHVIIAGYGVTGQELANALQECGTPYIVVDLNIENVRRAASHGEPACLGDITSPDVLEHLGLDHAKELVVAINDIEATALAIRAARSLAPKLRILARSHYVTDALRLFKAGATDVVSAEAEGAVQVTARILRAHNIEKERRDELVSSIRPDADDGV
jgi:CPA2 family monovalent cation:H+ antiporter-2